MELQQLAYFEVIAEESHFGRAGKRLSVAQPALTRQIQQLERELGVQLFDRSHRRIRLTEAGQALLTEARELLARAEQARDAARRAGRGGDGEDHRRLCWLGHLRAAAADFAIVSRAVPARAFDAG